MGRLMGVYTSSPEDGRQKRGSVDQPGLEHSHRWRWFVGGFLLLLLGVGGTHLTGKTAPTGTAQP